MVGVQKIGMYTGHRDCIYGLCEGMLSHQFLSAGGDGMVVLWDMENPDQGELIAKVPHSVYAIVADEQAQSIWIGQNFQGIHRIDAQTKKEVVSAAITDSYVFSLLLNGSALYCACGDGTVVVMDAQDLKTSQRFRLSQQSARILALSPDGRHLAIGYSDHYIRILDLVENRVKMEFQGHENSVFALTYSPDGRYLLSGGRDARLKIWNVNQDYALQQSIVAHMYAINDIAFSPDGRYFVTCSMDKSIKIWDATLFKLLKVIDKARHAGHGTSVNKVLWTSYKCYIVSGSDDRNISIWQVDL